MNEHRLLFTRKRCSFKNKVTPPPPKKRFKNINKKESSTCHVFTPLPRLGMSILTRAHTCTRAHTQTVGFQNSGRCGQEEGPPSRSPFHLQRTRFRKTRKFPQGPKQWGGAARGAEFAGKANFRTRPTPDRAALQSSRRWAP